MSKKIKVFRFMSKREFELYKSGIHLSNVKIHKGKTNSIGFCFLDYGKFKPEEAIHFLSGIVDAEVCAVFEVDQEKLNVSKATYADNRPQNDRTIEKLIEELCLNKVPMFETEEYCTTSYSKHDFKLVKYIEDIELFTKEYFERKDWEWIDEEQ